MANTVFILGAGASAEAGAPTMADFMDRAELLYRHYKHDPRRSEHLDKVFLGLDKLQDICSKSKLDIDNIETVFVAFEMALLIDELSDYEGNLGSLVDSLKHVIALTIEESLAFRANQSLAYPNNVFTSFAQYLTSEQEIQVE